MRACGRGVLTASIFQGMAITVPLGVPLFFLAALAAGHLGDVTGFSTNATIALTGAGVLHFVWGRYCNYRATRALGTNLVAPVQQFNLILSLLLAIWLLGEQLSVIKIFGIALILLGPAVTMRAGKSGGKAEQAEADAKIAADDEKKPVAFAPKYAEGYTFAFLSAIGYGISPILVRIGLAGQGVGTSLAGGLVAYLAATAVMVPIFLWPGNIRHAFAIDRVSTRWFTLSGFLVFLSQMFMYMAMTMAPVTVVAPINRLSIVFRLYFSRWLNPEHEVFGGSVIVGTVVSFAGAVALSLSTEVVQSIVPLPDVVVRLINWHWP